MAARCVRHVDDFISSLTSDVATANGLDAEVLSEEVYIQFARNLTGTAP